MGGTFELEYYETEKLRSLKSSQAQRVKLGQNVGTEPPNHLRRYDIKLDDNRDFMDLNCHPGALYERRDYSDLFSCVASKWSSNWYRVVLIGNAGIGKSWFQIFALKKLLDSSQRQYDIVIRQVNDTFYEVVNKLNTWIYKKNINVSFVDTNLIVFLY